MNNFTPVKIVNNSTTTELSHVTKQNSLNDTKSKEIDSLNWTLPELPTIENRIINKELETKRILINFILFLIIRLLRKFSHLILIKFDISHLIPKNETSNILSFVYKLIQILFWYNICNGLYKVFKPKDEFKDLKLTNEQRNLLGLPRLAQLDTVQLKKIEPTLTSKKSISLGSSPAKDSSTKLPVPFLNKTQGVKPLETPRVNKTPIASPMSSPSPLKRKSPRKSQYIPNEPKPNIINSTNGGNRLAQPEIRTRKSTLVNDITNTPTYIPSPKYFYRMDSPSKTRRI